MFCRMVVTGEGKSDMGICHNQAQVCSGADYDIGPVTLLLIKLLERHLPAWNADVIDCDHPELVVSFTYRGFLSEKAKQRKLIRPGKNGVEKGFVVHAQRAAELAFYAIDQEHQIAAYFHDTDGTRQELRNDPQRRRHLVDAINAGFRAAEFSECGVPVVPKPTSEAWFLCAIKKDPYQHCEALEVELSGNVRSLQRSPKSCLAEALGEPEYGREELCEIARSIDIARLDMPSFNELRADLKNAINAICGQVNE
jgi:hypothetical protein